MVRACHRDSQARSVWSSQATRYDWNLRHAAKFKSIEQAAQGQPGKSYFVAVLRVGDLRNAKFTVKPQPDVPGGYDISHAELPDLNAGNYKASETLERQRELAERLCLRVEGPFKAEEAACQ
jgi:hypothetical protein